MKKLIYIIPGILSDAGAPSLLKLVQEGVDATYDVKIHDSYGTLTKETTHADLVKHLEQEISKLHYDSIHLISHSSGSELILRANLPEKVRSAALWSPSWWCPQRVTGTLSRDADGWLILDKETRLGEQLASDLDSLDTASVVSRFNLPYITFITPEDNTGTNASGYWKNVTLVPYGHNYTYEQMETLLEKCKGWFV